MTASLTTLVAVYLCRVSISICTRESLTKNIFTLYHPHRGSAGTRKSQLTSLFSLMMVTDSPTHRRESFGVVLGLFFDLSSSKTAHELRWREARQSPRLKSDILKIFLTLPSGVEASGHYQAILWLPALSCSAGCLTSAFTGSRPPPGAFSQTLS